MTEGRAPFPRSFQNVRILPGARDDPRAIDGRRPRGARDVSRMCGGRSGARGERSDAAAHLRAVVGKSRASPDVRADNPFRNLDRIAIDPRDVPRFTATHRPDVLGGVLIIEGRASLIDDANGQANLYRTTAPSQRDITIRAVPYCTWDNREPGEMRVWLRRVTL